MQMKRQTRKQKRTFRQSVLADFTEAYVDSHALAKNIIIGNIEEADTIVTAHYDTPPKLPTWFVRHLILWAMVVTPFALMGWFEVMFRLPLWISHPLIMTNLDLYFTAVLAIGYGVMFIYIAHLFGLTPFLNEVNMNDNTSGVAVVMDMAKRHQGNKRYAFVLFDNEEKGLFGSIAFRSRYNEQLKGKRIVVIDCVGLGDVLNLYTWGAKTDVVQRIENLQDDTTLELKHRRSTIMSMSDHFAFRGLNAVLMLANYNKPFPKWKFWRNRNSLGSIHTKRDNNIKVSNLYQVMNLIESV